MNKSALSEIFSDVALKNKIKDKLPYLFQLAELESSRAGKLGMEVGSARERVIIALLMHKFGEKNVKTDVPITKAETDVLLFDEPISIKTMTGNKLGPVKLIWTVDAKKALEFSKNYNPSVDILLAHINWDGEGAFYFFPAKEQMSILKKIGRENYIKLPKQGTNPRGVEMTGEAIDLLAKATGTQKVDIFWKRQKIDFNPYTKWVEHWEK